MVSPLVHMHLIRSVLNILFLLLVNIEHRCVADCVGVQPCGRKRDKWETAFLSVEVCCQTISSWKPFADCSYAASSATTSTSPSKSPTADTRWYVDASPLCFLCNSCSLQSNCILDILPAGILIIILSAKMMAKPQHG